METGCLISEALDAAWFGDIAALHKLCERGADLRAADRNGLTPLHMAAMEGRTDIVEFLVTAAVPVDARTRFGDTPLFDAALRGHVATVAALIGAGADVNAGDRRGDTPLHVAAYAGNVAAALILIDRGAAVARQSR